MADPSGRHSLRNAFKSLLQVALQLLVENVKVMKAPASVPFGAAEDHHVNSKPSADLARALRPRTILKNPSIDF
jgi:hypothetical protein